MTWLTHPRTRIGLSLILALVISGFIMHYSQTNSRTIPELNAKRIMTDIGQAFTHTKDSISASLLSLRIPTSTPKQQPTGEPEQQQIEGNTGVQNPVLFDTGTPITPTTTAILPISSTPLPSVTLSGSITRIPTIKPTLAPTKTPLPTATPPPSFAPVTSNERPGGSLNDIFNEVQERMCVPAAFMKAIQEIETGERFRNYAAAHLKFINTYGWWNSDSVSENDLFNGYAYSAQHGTVPSDSKFAGERIATAIQPNAYDQVIMGVNQISQQEQEVTRKNTVKVLPNNIDRRVVFDNLVIFASATLGRVGNATKTSCSDWPESTVRLAAEKHYGSCGDSYCDRAWSLYKQYK